MYFTIEIKNDRIVGTCDNTQDDFYNSDWFKSRYRFVDVNEYLNGIKFADETGKITEIMNAAGLYHDICKTNKGYEIEIEWGDWKHDHQFTDDIMEALGYELTMEVETETDGSDCYSSIHYFKRKAV